MFGHGAGAALAAIGVCFSLAVASPAAAETLTFPFEEKFPSDGLAGTGAGRMKEPHGIAFNPVNKRLYVADTENARVDVFTPWGEFVTAFGWGVEDGEAELQACTSESGCLPGLRGSGPGQFGYVPGKSQYTGPTGIAVDAAGDVYVMDLGNFRVQKFDASGKFLLTFGGEVNKTTNGNLCTAASGDVCGGGVIGTGPGEFSIENVSGVLGDYLDVGPDETVYVGDRNRIQAFEPSGAFDFDVPLPEPGNPGALAVDEVSGALLFAYNQPAAAPQPDVFELATDGTELGVISARRPLAIATDEKGNVYVGNDPEGAEPGQFLQIFMYDAARAEIGSFGELGPKDDLLFGGLEAGTVTSSGGIDTWLTRFNPVGEDVIGHIKAYGAVPDPTFVGPPPQVPPTLDRQLASAVGTIDATLQADVNPHYWTDTRYYVEYGTVDCSVGPCASLPAPPGNILTTEVVNRSLRTAGVTVEGLQPGTTYHYRFVAESAGGGPVFGADRTFTTAPLPAPPAKCPANEAARFGLSARLPDCRGYEMVSPVDKAGADISSLLNGPELPARRQQASLDGGRLTYSAYKAFGDSQSSPYSSQYLAELEPQAGWLSTGISPPRKGATLVQLNGLDAQFKAFSPDLCTAWFLQDTALLLDESGVPGYPNLYKADLCGGGGYEAVTIVKPPARKPNQFVFELQGYSADSEHSVFRTNDKLAATALATDSPQVYDSFLGKLRPVCVLPNKTAVAECSVGTAWGEVPSEARGSLKNAVSDDGTRIYWSAARTGPGKLYLRANGIETTPISGGPARFEGASPDGGKVVYSEGGNLLRFEVGSSAPEAGTVIAEGVQGVIGMSEDTSSIYLVSTQALAGAAVAGKPNLYLLKDGAFTFIAELKASDLTAPLSPVAAEPFMHMARVTPDGRAVAFTSSRSLKGQENSDVNSGEPDAQVFLYRADEEALRCVSCNRTGAAPLGRDIDQGEFLPYVKGRFWAAALLPTTESQLYSPRALSDDGSRLFFESFDALVPADTNQALDVYQWEAGGTGTCSDPEGCVDLISSGQDPQRSDFVDASSDGSNVFISTEASLLPQDPALVDIYAARVDGGFPPPESPPPPCVGEACQPPPEPAPEALTPSSATFTGPGNTVEKIKQKKCPKGKHKVKRHGKVRCVKKKHRRASR